jgi:membrane associated rhomboid family serine protease
MDFILAHPVASLIMALTIITSVMAFSNAELLSNLILHPYGVYRKQRVYTVITSGLIHNDWMHLIFNMFSYFFFAFVLEEKMGHWQFAFLYIASLILSDLPTVFKKKNNYNYYCLGASGAVSAVIFGYIMYYPLDKMMIIPIPFEIPAIIFGVLYLVYCHFAAKHARDNVNHDAHMFGALSGILITVGLNYHCLPEFFHQINLGVRSYLH